MRCIDKGRESEEKKVANLLHGDGRIKRYDGMMESHEGGVSSCVYHIER